MNGAHDGLPENCVFDVAVCRDLQDKEKSYFLPAADSKSKQSDLCPSSSLSRDIKLAFAKEGYEEFPNQKLNETKTSLSVRELGIAYPLTSDLPLRSLLHGRAVRQAFFLDVLDGLYSSSSSPINVVCFNLMKSSSSLLCHLAAVNETVDKCFVFEATAESIVACNELVKFQNREDQDSSSSSNVFVSDKTVAQISTDELKNSEELRLFRQKKYFPSFHSSESEQHVQLATIEIFTTKTEKGDKNNTTSNSTNTDSSIFGLHKFTVKKAIEMTYRGCFKKTGGRDDNNITSIKPARLFLVVFNDDDENNSAGSTSAEGYALKLLRESACSFSHLSFRFAPDIDDDNEARDVGNKDMELVQRAMNVMNQHDEGDNKVSPFHPCVRIVKKVGAGPEFAKRVSKLLLLSKSGEGGRCSLTNAASCRDVCGLLIEIW